MKTFISLFALLFSVSVFGDVGPSGHSNVMALDGTVTHVEKHFIYVKNNAGSGSALDSGKLVVLDTSVADGVTVTTSATAGAFPHCVIAQSSCSQGQLCKCQVSGLIDVDFDTGSPIVSSTAGQGAFLGETNAGFVQATAFASIAASDRPIGVFQETTAASGPVSVYLKLRQ